MDWSALIQVGRIAGFINAVAIPLGIATQLMFYRAVPGTHRRFVLNTLFTAYLVLETMIVPLIAVGYSIAGDRWWGGIYTVLTPISFYNLHFHRKNYGDEDNFWKGMGGRIKKLLTRPIRRVVPVTR